MLQDGSSLIVLSTMEFSMSTEKEELLERSAAQICSQRLRSSAYSMLHRTLYNEQRSDLRNSGWLWNRLRSVRIRIRETWQKASNRLCSRYRRPYGNQLNPMSILLTIISILLIILSALMLCSVVLLGMLYYNIRKMRDEMDVIFNASINAEEFLAGMSADRNLDFSAN